MKFINESRLIELIYLVFYDYLIERFSEVLNLHHHYSIFHLNDLFPCEIYQRRDYTAEIIEPKLLTLNVPMFLNLYNFV